MISPSEVLAAFALRGSPKPEETLTTNLSNFLTEEKMDVPKDVLADVLEHLDPSKHDGDIQGWIVKINFMAHPHANWDFLIDLVAAARSDTHLMDIAAGTALPVT